MADTTKTASIPNSFGFGQKKSDTQEGQVPLRRGRAHLGEDLSGVDKVSERYGYDRSSVATKARPEKEKATAQLKVRLPPTLYEEVQGYKDSQVGLTTTKLFADAWEAFKEKYPERFS